MTDLINQLQYLSRVTKDYDQEHMTSADYEMIPTVTKQAADRIEELVKERKAMAMRDAGYDVYAGLEAKLAKAVEALQKIAVHPALWHTLASKVLAELEGDNV